MQSKISLWGRLKIKIEFCSLMAIICITWLKYWPHKVPINCWKMWIFRTRKNVAKFHQIKNLDGKKTISGYCPFKLPFCVGMWTLRDGAWTTAWRRWRPRYRRYRAGRRDDPYPGSSRASWTGSSSRCFLKHYSWQCCGTGTGQEP